MDNKSILNNYVGSLFDKVNKTKDFMKLSPFKRMEDFFLHNDWIDTTNYYNNLKMLNCEFDISIIGSYKLASYDVCKNVILYCNEDAISHELLHVASSKDNSISGLMMDGDNLEKENVAFNEGIVSYFDSVISGTKVNSYIFEAFVVRVLANFYGNILFKDFFKADFDSFINQFDDDEVMDICCLIEALDYHYKAYSKCRGNKSCSCEVLNEIQMLQQYIFSRLCNLIVHNTNKNVNCDGEGIFMDIFNILDDMELSNGYLIEYDASGYIKDLIYELVSSYRRGKRI